MVLPLLAGLLLEAFMTQALNNTLTLLPTPLSIKCLATNCLPDLSLPLLYLRHALCGAFVTHSPTPSTLFTGGTLLSGDPQSQVICCLLTVIGLDFMVPVN